MNDSIYSVRQPALCIKDLSLKNENGDYALIKAGTVIFVDTKQNVGFFNNVVFEIPEDCFSLKFDDSLRNVAEAITTQDILLELGRDSLFIKKESSILVDTVEEIAYFENTHFDISRHEYLICT